jgi:hypothetical protein
MIIMDAVVLNENTIKYAEMYAKLHNISVSDAIEKGVMMLLGKKFSDTAEFQDALAYVRSLKAEKGRPVPENDNGLDALIEMKYGK